MKKTLIAAAVAATVAAPAAFADITMGGQLQAEVVSVSKDAAATTTEGVFLTDAMEGGAVNKGNASSFFIKGAHDLGNGITALYKVNTNPKWVAEAGAGLGTRDAFIGLKTGFGTFLAGRIATPYKTSTVKWDPFLGTFMQARGSSGMSGLHNGYADNVVAYANKFGPATLVAAVAFDESNDNPADGEADGDHALTASVNVPVGPVEIALAYIDTAGLIGADGTDNFEAIKAGAKFNTGAITLAAQYESIDVGGTKNADVIYGTGSFKAGSNTFALSYGQTQPDAAGAADSDYLAIGVKHAMGKKVSVHAGYTENGVSDAATQTFGAGLRVKF